MMAPHTYLVQEPAVQALRGHRVGIYRHQSVVGRRYSVASHDEHMAGRSNRPEICYILAEEGQKLALHGKQEQTA